MATETPTTPLHRFDPLRYRGPRRRPGDFPVQPSQKDGLGRMCKPHWREYTNALRKTAVARRAEATTEVPAPESEPEVIETADETPEPETSAPPPIARTKVEPTEAAAE